MILNINIKQITFLTEFDLLNVIIPVKGPENKLENNHIFKYPSLKIPKTTWLYESTK